MFKVRRQKRMNDWTVKEWNRVSYRERACACVCVRWYVRACVEGWLRRRVSVEGWVRRRMKERKDEKNILFCTWLGFYTSKVQEPLWFFLLTVWTFLYSNIAKIFTKLHSCILIYIFESVAVNDTVNLKYISLEFNVFIVAYCTREKLLLRKKGQCRSSNHLIK